MKILCLCLILATTLLCGCATLDTTFEVLKVVTFPVGVLGTIAGNPVDTFYTVQQVQKWVKPSSRSTKNDTSDTVEHENPDSGSQERVDNSNESVSDQNPDPNPQTGADDPGNNTSSSDEQPRVF